MTANPILDEEEKPLDPATEKIRRKMMRLLTISIGIMFVGLMAVLGAIVYKIGGRDEVVPTARMALPGDPVSEGRLELPQGAVIQSTALDGDRVLLQLRLADGSVQLHVYSLSEGGVIARVSVD